MSNVLKLLYNLRERVKNDPALKGKNPDQLTLTILGMRGVKKFFEGYYGKDAFSAKLQEGARLRATDPNEYERRLENYQALTPDLRPIRGLMRLAETLTTSDLTYGIGSIRDAELNDNRPAFTTDIFGMVRRRTREDLSLIKTTAGVALARRFLNVRAEGTTNSQNSWVGQGEDYSMFNLEDGFELSWEALMGNRYNEWLEAMYELGQNAARSRAWLVVDAVRRSANFIALPDSALGPTMSNLDAIDNRLGTQIVDGRARSATLTDIYVPIAWKGVANRAIGTASLAVVGAASGPATLVPNDNPVYMKYQVHPEEILTEAPITAEQLAAGQSNKDWIAADRSKQPVEFSALAGFEAGARVLTKVSDIAEGELDNMGSFDEHVIETKVTDVCAAQVRDKTAIALIKGS